MESNFEHLISTLLADKAHSATMYVTPRLIVRATRKLYKYNGRSLRGTQTEILLTIGKPNFRERAFIKQCKKAGEPFPIKNVQLRFPPKKKVKK